VGGISLGGASVGLVALGGAGLGFVSIAGLAVGAYAAGGAAIGYVACGGAALAWHLAEGGMAVAHDYALGGAVQARHANDALAHSVGDGLPLLRRALRSILSQSGFGWFQTICWSPILLLIWQSKRTLRAMREHAKALRR